MDFLTLKSLGVLHLAVILLGCFNVLAYETSSIAQPPAHPPAEAPHHHKGGHHHHHHQQHHPPTPPPAHPPVKPPTQPPVKPPAHPPVKPPAHPPVKPPAHPPVKPPAHPPVKPPAHPPVKPPAHPPSYAPGPMRPRKLVAVQGVVYCKSCKYPGIGTLLGATPLLGAVVRLQCNNTKYPLVAESKTDKNGYFFITAPKKVTTYGSHKCKVFVVSSPLVTCNKPTNLHYGLKGAILMPSSKPPSSQPPLAFDLFTVGPFAFEPSSKIPCPK